MFDTKDFFGVLFLLGGLFMASNMSLVSEKPKSLTNLAENKSLLLVSESVELDESLENSMLMDELAQITPKNNDAVEAISTQFLTRPRRVQKLVLNGN